MIYSRWDPSSGRYDYFETPEALGRNDDLPVPRLPAGGAIGVASVAAGRPLPGDATPIGSGERALGSIVPTVRGGVLAGLAGAIDPRWLWLGGGVVVGLGVGFLLWRRR